MLRTEMRNEILQCLQDGRATALENAVAMYDLRFTTYDLFKPSLQDEMA